MVPKITFHSLYGIDICLMTFQTAKNIIKTLYIRSTAFHTANIWHTKKYKLCRISSLMVIFVLFLMYMIDSPYIKCQKFQSASLFRLQNHYFLQILPSISPIQSLEFPTNSNFHLHELATIHVPVFYNSVNSIIHTLIYLQEISSTFLSASKSYY